MGVRCANIRAVARARAGLEEDRRIQRISVSINDFVGEPR